MVNILLEGTEAWNAWRRAHELRPEKASLTALVAGAELPGANLSNLRIHEGDFSSANLQGARFDDCIIEYANFSGANLAGASFYRTHIYLSRFNGADLRNARFHRSSIDHVELDGANLAKSSVFETAWSNLNLANVKGLEEIKHDGPSSVGIDTIYASGGGIPEIFLRGAGVPDSLIDLQKTLVQAVSPIQFYSCFISYSHKDEDFARRLHGRLQQEGLRVWFAPEEMKAGRKLIEQVDEAIRVYDKLLVVLSEASMSSAWVKTELSMARQREQQERRRVLFPVRLVDVESIQGWKLFDHDLGSDTAQELREYFLLDFSTWKDHDQFERSMIRLLDALRA